MQFRLLGLLAAICSLLACTNAPQAGDHRVFECASSEDVYEALRQVGPGDTIVLQGGTVYEIDKSFELNANGTDDARIRFTSKDVTNQDRYAVISTTGGKKEETLFALTVRGSFWDISRLEIAGKRVPLADGFWDTNGFRIGLYFLGSGSHHNVVEDVHIHHTHNTAVAVRNESHHITFRRMKIHHIGEWLDADYNAHEGEGFYLGSSKGVDERGNNAIAHDILIEDSVIGPGLLGQYVDIKYGTSQVTVRNNTFFCGEKSYNEEVIKLAGYANLIENNRFVGSSESLRHYIHVFNKKTGVPVRVDYLGETDIPSPTGRDNTVVNNVFYTDDASMQVVQNDLAPADRASFRFENNRIESLSQYLETTKN
jgi:hypothetical protein